MMKEKTWFTLAAICFVIAFISIIYLGMPGEEREILCQDSKGNDIIGSKCITDSYNGHWGAPVIGIMTFVGTIFFFVQGVVQKN